MRLLCSSSTPPAAANRIFSAPTPPRGLDREVAEASPGDGEGGGTVHVAVGREREKGAELVRWTAGKFSGWEICVVHVHQPSKSIPTLLGNMPESGANKEVVVAHRRQEWEQTKKLLNYYGNVCRKMEVKMSALVIESQKVHKGIVDLAKENGIRKLVMGAAPVTCWLKVNSISKSSYTARNAPPWCEIWFINKDQHVWTREAVEFMHSVPQVDQQMTVNPDTQLRKTLPYNMHTTVEGIWSKSDSLHDSIKLEEESLYVKVVNVNKEVETLRNETVDELLKRKKAEAEAREAIKKTEAFEFASALEIERRREAEGILRCIREKQSEVLKKGEEAEKEMQSLKACVTHLESDVQKGNYNSKEASSELKDIQASITAMRLAKQKLSRQKMDAVYCFERWKNHIQGEFISCNHYTGYEDMPQLVVFSLSDVETATCDFSERFKLGQGGYGCVYKGEMLDKTVAIKRLYPQNSHGRLEFQQEVQVLGKLKHPHLVNLIGLCPEAWSLVYEYIPCGSLEDRLFRSNNVSPLTWKIRVRIISEIASVLLFLHTSKPKMIIHGDLKPGNILLDSDLSCKICDFGISRLVSPYASSCPRFRSNSGPKGAFAYSDPEFDRTGILTPKSDIYSFGVIILQLLTGRPPAGLVGDIRKAVFNGNVASVLHSTGEEWPSYVAKRLADLGLMFCEMNSRDRPGLTTKLVKELERLQFVEEKPVPCFFQCPINKELMHDPQIAADGFSYDGDSLREWLSNGHHTSPMTNLQLSHLQLTPNHALRHAIQEWVCKS
uniref:RING-type E3 ubiquitin transferase n=1 Tax=Kalanchoe fedtschenkoi TaxID=63787 RepID=A0A7N0U3J1_KALFE